MTAYLEMFGTLAIAEIPAELNQATPDPFAVLQANPEAQLIYLIELYPYDTTQANVLGGMPPFGTLAIGEYDATYLGGLTLVCLSDAGFLTEPSDSVANKYYIAQVDNPFQFDVSILSGSEFGNANQSYGAIVVKNGDGLLDYLANYLWPYRRVVIKAGARNFRYSQFAIIFDGSANEFETDDEQITLTIQDNRIKTDQPITSGVYAGTGGINGGANLANKYKPLAYGVITNCEPVLVDAVNLVYQVHDGSIQSVDAVRDRGVTLTNGGDVADITVASVSAGQYKTQLSGGYIKLGSTPAGRITMDLHGENGNGGYVSKTGQIIKRIVTTRLGTTPIEDAYIDSGSLNRLDLALVGDVGLYIDQAMTGSNAIDQLISDIGAYWTFTRQGLLTVGAVNSPGVETATITIDAIDEQGIKLERIITPAWRISVGYAPAWVVQDESELAAGTTATDRSFVSNEYRYLTYEDRGVRGRNSQSLDKVFKTNLASQTDAQTLLNRLVNIYGQQRQVFRVTIYRALFKLYLGDTVKLIYNRHNLQGGKNFIVVGVSEDAETGASVLELWG